MRYVSITQLMFVMHQRSLYHITEEDSPLWLCSLPFWMEMDDVYLTC